MIHFMLLNKAWQVIHQNGAHLGELYQEVDGYYVWWPDDRRGYLEARILRAIADKLDELNEEWDQEVKRGLATALAEHVSEHTHPPGAHGV